MKYLQGRERGCVLNVCGVDFILFVTSVAASTCFFLYIPVVFILFYVSLLVHVFLCQLYLSAKCFPSISFYLRNPSRRVYMFDDLNVYLCMYVYIGKVSDWYICYLLFLHHKKFMFKCVSHTMEPRSPKTGVDRMFHNL